MFHFGGQCDQPTGSACTPSLREPKSCTETNAAVLLLAKCDLGARVSTSVMLLFHHAVKRVVHEWRSIGGCHRQRDAYTQTPSAADTRSSLIGETIAAFLLCIHQSVFLSTILHSAEMLSLSYSRCLSCQCDEEGGVDLGRVEEQRPHTASLQATNGRCSVVFAVGVSLARAWPEANGSISEGIQEANLMQSTLLSFAYR